MKSYAAPVAYIRRSFARKNDPGDISREFQTEAVRELAGSDGERLLVLDQDWGRSAATDKTARRLAFLGLMEAIERGEVSTVYAYSADRLARSIEWSSRLWNACVRSGTRIVTTMRPFDPAARDDAEWAIWHYEALANEQALRGMERKAQAAAARRKARGDALGVAPFGYKIVGGKRVQNSAEPIIPIVRAFRQSGSAYGAARILNAAGSRTRRGALWTSKVVLDVLKREGVIQRRVRQPGVKHDARWLFFRLLRCHCGHVMTGMDNRTPRYTCYKARQVPDHPRPFGIAENKLVEWAKQESARLHVGDLYRRAEVDEQKRAELAERERRLRKMYLDRRIEDDEYEAEGEAIDGEREALEAAGQSVIIGPVDWSASPEEINRQLRSIWRWVELGPDLMPVRAEWRVPEWRRDEPVPVGEPVKTWRSGTRPPDEAIENLGRPVRPLDN